MIHGCLKASAAEYRWDCSAVHRRYIRCLACGDMVEGNFISLNFKILSLMSSVASSAFTNGCLPVNRVKAMMPQAQMSAP